MIDIKITFIYKLHKHMYTCTVYHTHAGSLNVHACKHTHYDRIPKSPHNPIQQNEITKLSYTI